MCRYLKNELVHKGALDASSIPEEFNKAADQKSTNNIFSKKQHDRFDTEILLTGAWFLESEFASVHKEEAYLVPTPNPEAEGTAVLEVEDDDEAFEDEPVAPVAQPKPRGSRKRKNAELEADENAATGVPASTQASQQTQSRAPSSTQGSHGAVVDANVTQASQGTRPVADRRERSSTHASQGGLTQAASQPISSNGEQDCGQSPLRLAHSKRPLPVPKLAATSSSSPEIPKLPMYLAKGDIVDLIRVTNLKKRIEPQLVDIVEHIKKVSPLSYFNRFRIVRVPFISISSQSLVTNTTCFRLGWVGSNLARLWRRSQSMPELI